MSDTAEVERLLRLCSRPDPGRCDPGAVREAFAGVSTDPSLVPQAENHGLAPLLLECLAAAGVEPDASLERRLKALRARHRHANAVRERVLGEILAMLSDAGIDVAVLKGAALMHLLYGSPELRPMRDLDLLVAPADTGTAQRLLQDAGFDAPQRPPSRFLARHHHLPVASRDVEGLNVSVEIHRDALSGDVRDSIRLDRLEVPLQRLEVAGRETRALGHEDMLRHLCHHTLEPAARIRLISIADTVGYADRFAPEIDWKWLSRRHPHTVNAVRMMHFVTPLPERLRAFVPPPTGEVPSGVGRAIRPLSQIRPGRRPVRDVYREILYPSDWWLRAHYGVPNDAPLAWCRWVRHPLRVSGWLLRRAQAWSASDG